MITDAIREELCKANQALLENNLVKWTSGNVSYRDPETQTVLIKPSGVAFDKLTPESLVLLDLDGNVLKGDLKPSVDTASHLYVFRNNPNVHSITHTHSPFATSFAIRGIDLKSYTTTAGNMFGEAVKCSTFAVIGEEEIGKQIIENLGDNCAVLIKSHGVFTTGASIKDSLKTAILLEETAEYAHYATLHDPDILPLSKEIVEAGKKFYRASYGQ